MSTHECLVAFFISNINWEADIPWLLWPFLTILFVIPTMFLFSACRICLSFFARYYFFYFLPRACLLSVANLALFRAELVIFKPVIYMLFLLCSVLAACSFYWPSESQGEGRNLLTLSEAPLLMLAAQGQEEGHTSPYALHCSTPLAGTTSASFCNLSSALRTTGAGLSQSHCHVTEGKKEALVASAQYQSSISTIFLTGRQKESHQWGRFQWKRKKIRFILSSSGDGLKKGTWLLCCSTHWQWCSTGKDTLKLLLHFFFFQRVSKCVCTHRYTYMANEQVQGRKDRGNSFIYLHRYYDIVICIQNECQHTSVTCTVWIITVSIM